MAQINTSWYLSERGGEERLRWMTQVLFREMKPSHIHSIPLFRFCGQCPEGQVGGQRQIVNIVLGTDQTGGWCVFATQCATGTHASAWLLSHVDHRREK